MQISKIILPIASKNSRRASSILLQGTRNLLMSELKNDICHTDIICTHYVFMSLHVTHHINAHFIILYHLILCTTRDLRKSIFRPIKDSKLFDLVDSLISKLNEEDSSYTYTLRRNDVTHIKYEEG